MSDNNPHPTLSRYADFVVKYRWWVVLFSVLISAALGSGLRFLEFNKDYQVFFGDDNPQLLAFHEMQSQYDKSDNVLIVVTAKPGHQIFETKVLQAIEEISYRAQREIPYAYRVDSITNYQHTTADGDELIVAPLIEDAEQLNSAQIEKARDIALNEPSLVGRFLSKDHQTSAVNITFEMPLLNPTKENTEIVDAIRNLSNDISSRYPVTIGLTGMLIVNETFYSASQRDLTVLYPIMYLIIIIMILLLTRSLSAALGCLIVITISVVSSLGITGMLGLELTAASAATPTIITTLAIADSIHFLITMLGQMREGKNKRSAITEAIKIDFKPLFLTSATTIIGFLSLNFSDSPPFRDLGNMTAIGVSFAFIYSVLFLPAFLMLVPIKAKQQNAYLNVFMYKLGTTILAHRKVIFIACLAVSVVLLSFLSRNQLRDDFVKYFDNSVPFRATTDLVSEHFGGFNPIYFSINSGESNGISEPKFLEQLDQFKLWLQQQPEISHVSVISDTFKRLNKSLHADNTAYYKLPSERDEAAQYLLLYELSLPYGLGLNNQLNIDKSATKVEAIVTDIPSDHLISLTHRIEQWIEQNLNQQSLGVSSALMFAYISERNVKGMLKGTLGALLLISLIIMIALRSLRLGLISLIPNILPAGLAFGVWGLLSGEINLAVAAVTGMTLGIVVDDSVHFLTQCNYARHNKGMDNESAILYAFEHVGTAIVITTIVLISGFFILSLSPFGLNSDTGKLAAITIFIALIADLLLLPCLLSWFSKK